jgi:hypothetical protein
METAVKQILRIKWFVSSLGLSQDESLTFMAGMFTQHLLGSDGLLRNEAAVPGPTPTTELPKNEINSRPSELPAEQDADEEDPHVAQALASLVLEPGDRVKGAILSAFTSSGSELEWCQHIHRTSQRVPSFLLPVF